jgi:precorrin-2 dehydrogenase/sirohydrochlorin ferrochelatase
MPALVRRGTLRLALSTEEASPALAGRLRGELERLFDDRFVRFLEWMGALRERLRAEEPSAEKRALALRQAAEGFSIEGVLHYPASFDPDQGSPP